MQPNTSIAASRRPSGSEQPAHSLLSRAVLLAMLLGSTQQAAAQSLSSVDGQLGRPDSWNSTEFAADWGLAAINAQEAYARGLDGKGVRLGVFDSGSGLDHPEFVGKDHHALTLADILTNGGACTNTTVLSGPNACFSSVGDQVAIDYVGYAADVPQAIRNIIETGPYKHGISYNIHGTHVAGTMVANRDGSGVHGVAYGANLTAAKLFFNSASEWRSVGSIYEIVNAVSQLGPSDTAIAGMFTQMNADGVRAINHSWGLSSEPDQTQIDAFYADLSMHQHLSIFAEGSREKGLIQVWAAGNTTAVIPSPEQSPIAGLYATLPRAFPDIEPYWLSVVNVDQTLQLSNRSNRCGLSANWCVAAPGTNITSTIYSEDSQLNGHIATDARGNISLNVAPHQPNYGYGDLSGTSMAAPHVTGALALLIQRFPYLDNAQIRDVLLTTATDLGAAGVDEIYGWGLINLRKAIDGPGQLRVDTDVVMNQRAGGLQTWSGQAWDDWRNDIAGPGKLTKSGIGWLRLSGDNRFAGASVREGILELTGNNTLTGTVSVDGNALVLVQGHLNGSDLNINAGYAVVNGHVTNGTTTVAAGAVLAGSGTLADTVVRGTIAPGNSIGTLTIAGNYTQAAGSYYALELLPPDQADQLNVSGRAVLQGGTLKPVLTAGAYLLGQQYHIVHADTGVSGGFASLDTSTISPFLHLQLAYGGHDVALNVARGAALVSATQTANQRAVADAADAADDADPLLQRLVTLQPAQARAAFEHLDGELHASAKALLLQDARVVRDSALAHARTGQTPFGAQRDPDSGLGAWADVVHASIRLNGDGNAAPSRLDSNTTLVGLDLQLEGGWRLGVLGGGGKANLKVAERGAKADVDTRYAGLYAGQQWNGFGLRAGYVQSWQELDTERHAGVLDLSGQARARYDARTRQMFVEAGYRLEIGNAGLEPFVQLAQVQLTTDDAHERGTVASLDINGDTHKTHLTTTGVRFDLGLSTRGQQQDWLSLRGSLAYRHANGDIEPSTRAHWQTGQQFSVMGSPLARHATLAEIGLGARLSPNSLLEFGFSGLYAGSGHDSGLNARFSVQF